MRTKWIATVEAKEPPGSNQMLTNLPPELNLAQNVEYLKEKSSLKIFDRDANLEIDIPGQ